MKKLILAIIVLMMFFSLTVLAAGPALENVQRRVIINLCRMNADLADRLNNRLDEEDAKLAVGYGYYFGRFYYDNQGRMIDRIPTSAFFFMLDDLVKRNTEIKYNEIIDRLLIEQILLEAALRNVKNNFIAERIK